MRWLTAVALVLGGIIAGTIALVLHWSVLVAVPIGAIVGGMIHEPREVRDAFLRAVREVVEYDKYLITLKWISRLILNVALFIFGLFVGGLGIKLWSNALERFGLNSLASVTILSLVGWGILLLTFGIYDDVSNVPTDKTTRTEASSTTRAYQTEGPRWFGVWFAVAFPVLMFAGIPALLLAIIVVLGALAWLVIQAARAVPVLLHMIPAVFFRFVVLVSTQKRLTVMGSIAVGSLIGIALGNIITCGAVSLVIGALAIWTSEMVVARYQPQT